MSTRPQSTQRGPDRAPSGPESDATTSPEGTKRPRPRGQHRVPGSTWTYTPGKGLWDDRGNRLLDWCPVVTENLISYRDDGRVMGRSVTFEVGPHITTAEIGDLESGRAWEAVPGAAGSADRRVRDALTNIISGEAAKLAETVAHPRWVGDALQLPPRDCLPDGYLEQGGTFEGWCELMNRSADAPKIALVISLAVAGIYVKPCRRKSYVVHMKGVSSRGKTTTMLMSAGIFGNPEEGQVVENWNSTQNGIPAWLRGLRILPGFRDEIQSAGFTPAQTQDLMFRITGGGSRGQSTRTGGYRKPPATWNSALVSTGNVSIVGNTDNTAMFARVLEVDTPFTASAEQSEAFEEMALEHYGWGLPAIIEQGITPAEWSQWCAKALVALGNPSGDVLRRAGKHLAGAVAAARLLGRIIGNDRYESVVLDAGKDALESVASDLGFKGTNSPSQQFLYVLMDTMAQDPKRFPTPATWAAITSGDPDHRMPTKGILGWDISEEMQEGEVALIPAGFDEITAVGKITDRLIVLKELDRVGQLHRKKGARVFAKQAWIAGKNKRAYVISGLAALAEDRAEEADALAPRDEAPSTTPSTTPSTQKSGPDLRTSTPNTSSDPTRVVTYEAWADETLLGVLASPLASDAELEAAAAELERRDKAAQLPAERPEPPSEGASTGEQGSSRPRRSQTAKAARGSRVATNAQVSGPSEESAGNWDRWLADTDTVAALERAGITLTPDLARRALLAWHRITAGLGWDATPGRVGRNLYARLRSIHKNMPEIVPMTDKRANEISTGKDILVRTDFLSPLIRPEVGQRITSADVNNQFLTQAAMAVLGDGEPVTIKRVRDISLILKDPGYVILSKAVTVEDHPAFAGRTLKAGTAIPMPLAAYLHEWGVTLPVKEAVVWEKSGQRLNKHAEELKGYLTEARKWKNEHTEEIGRLASAIVEIAVKDVYAVTYGGQMRSERYAGEMLRRDWSDMVVALSYANALRGLDRAAYSVPVLNPETGKRNPYRLVTEKRAAGEPMGEYALGLIKDTAYFVHENEEPTLPECLEVPETKQFGKWKLEKHVDVTDEIAGAYDHGITALRNAINAEWKAGQK